MSKKARKPVMPPTSPSDDLVPPHMLPDVPTIKPGAGFGDDIKKAPAPKPKKMAGGGSASSRADGCAIRGKTRGKMV